MARATIPGIVHRICTTNRSQTIAGTLLASYI